MLSLRTGDLWSPVWQSPLKKREISIYRAKCLKIRGIPTPACALARNDTIFTALQTKRKEKEAFFIPFPGIPGGSSVGRCR